MTLAEIIINYRNEHGLSQRKFGEMCGFSNAYVSMLERQINPGTGKPIAPTVDRYYKIANAMGLSLEELVDMADDMPIEINSPKTEFTPEEKEFIRKMRQLDDRGKAAIHNALNFELRQIGK